MAIPRGPFSLLWLSIRYPSAISDSSRCHFRFPDSDVRLLNTRRRLREGPDARSNRASDRIATASKDIDLIIRVWETNFPTIFLQSIMRLPEAKKKLKSRL